MPVRLDWCGVGGVRAADDFQNRLDDAERESLRIAFAHLSPADQERASEWLRDNAYSQLVEIY